VKTFTKINLGLMAALLSLGLSAQAQQPSNNGKEGVKQEQVKAQGENEQKKDQNQAVNSTKVVKAKKHKQKKKKS
jgi:hypothetical protein